MDFARCMCVTLLWLSFAVVGAAQSQQAPAWKIDLLHNPPAQQFGSLIQPFERALQLIFIDNDTLLLAYKPAVKDYKPGTEPLWGGVLIDVPSGMLRPPQRGWSGKPPLLFGTAGANLLVSTMVSKTKELQLDPIGKSHARESRWWPQPCDEADKISPDGRTVAVYRYRFRPNPPEVMFLDSETFADTGKRFNGFVSSMSNDAIVWRDRSGPVINPIFVQDTRGTRELYRPDCTDEMPFFVDDYRVLIAGCKRFRVVDLAGKLLYQETFSPQTTKGWVTVDFEGAARNGSRFAVSANTWESADPPIVIKQQIAVYDVASGKPVLTIQPEDREPIVVPGLWALSPDGSLLANVTRAIVRLYRVSP